MIQLKKNQNVKTRLFLGPYQKNHREKSGVFCEWMTFKHILLTQITPHHYCLNRFLVEFYFVFVFWSQLCRNVKLINTSRTVNRSTRKLCKWYGMQNFEYRGDGHNWGCWLSNGGTILCNQQPDRRTLSNVTVPCKLCCVAALHCAGLSARWWSELLWMLW